MKSLNKVAWVLCDRAGFSTSDRMVLPLKTSHISYPLEPVVCLPFSKVLVCLTSWALHLGKSSAMGDHRENFTEPKNLQDA